MMLDSPPSPPLATIVDRLADLGSARWWVHYAARERIAAGQDMIDWLDRVLD